MRYLFIQNSTGHATSAITLVIVENPEIKDGVVYATKVGNISGFDDEGEYEFVSCTPAKFIAGGGPWNMTEYTKELK